MVYIILLLVAFIIRTNENSKLFKSYEKKKNLNYELNLLFFNQEHFLYFQINDEKYYEIVVRFLKQHIKGEVGCIVCYEKFDGYANKLRICDKCGVSICRKCIVHMYCNQIKMKFPVCREPILKN